MLALLLSSAANTREADTLGGTGGGELWRLGLAVALKLGLGLGLGSELLGVGVIAGDVAAAGEVVTAKCELIGCGCTRPQATEMTRSPINRRLTNR